MDKFGMLTVGSTVDSSSILKKCFDLLLLDEKLKNIPNGQKIPYFCYYTAVPIIQMSAETIKYTKWKIIYE